MVQTDEKARDWLISAVLVICLSVTFQPRCEHPINILVYFMESLTFPLVFTGCIISFSRFSILFAWTAYVPLLLTIRYLNWSSYI
jgi:hypothetical protein